MPWEEGDLGGSSAEPDSLLFPWRHMSVHCHTEVSWEARVAWGVGSE